MASDPVSTAYRRAVAAVTERAACPDRASCSALLSCIASDVTATAITEFLRALPPGMVRWGSGNSFDPDDKPTLRTLAGKVERAAKGAR